MGERSHRFRIHLAAAHAPVLCGRGAQGALAATEKLLLVPGGRSMPAAFDRQTGELAYFHLDAGGKGNGGSLVLANESQLFVHTRLRGVRGCDLKSGRQTRFTCNEPVLAAEGLYTAGPGATAPSIEALGRDKKRGGARRSTPAAI